MKFIIFLSLLISFNVFSNRPVEQGDKITAKRFNNQTFTVGDIKHSLLTTAQFQGLMGDCWVVMGGQDVSGSDYATLTGKNALPDASGKFLRNTGGNAPLLGESQLDAFQGHWHASRGSSFTERDNGFSPYLLDGTGSTFSDPNSGKIRAVDPITDGVNGTPRTSNETRPVNVGVNLFVKINHQCN